jgi:hypothetical protein
MAREDSGVYRRSVKNYLLNLRYQLKFTLTMVFTSIAVTAALVTGLGYIIMNKIHEASRIVDVRAADPTDELAQQLVQQFASNDRVMLMALIGFGVLFGIVLSAALTVYGIILTHKVAGPLYKISLYLDKIRDGKLGMVYNLRKGDELVDFFEHFKGAHDSLRHRAEQDIALIDKAIVAAERAGDTALVEELKRTLKQKQESLQ